MTLTTTTLGRRIGIALAMFTLASCSTTSPGVASKTNLTDLRAVSNEDLAKEYERRTLMLLYGLPPVQNNAQVPEEFRTNYLVPHMSLQEWTRQFVADHVVFADTGKASSMSMVAMAYYEGWPGVPENKCKAVDYAIKAAKRELDSGAPVLAVALLDGVILPQDRKQAYFWPRHLQYTDPWRSYGRDPMNHVLSKFTDAEKSALDQEWLKWSPELALRKMEVKCPQQ